MTSPFKLFFLERRRIGQACVKMSFKCQPNAYFIEIWSNVCLFTEKLFKFDSSDQRYFSCNDAFEWLKEKVDLNPKIEWGIKLVRLDVKVLYCPDTKPP